MESIQKAFDITTPLTTNADSRQAFQLIPTLDSERFHTLVHSYRRPALTRSVSDPAIKTTNKSDNTLTETPTRHNGVSPPLRRFATMPPPSTTGSTPLTPGPNTKTYAIYSSRRTVNPISATNLFPDETPDTDIAGSTTEPAYFSDIDEDDPSPHGDEPLSMDDDVPVIRVATDTGGVDTGYTAPAPHDDITIRDTNNPTDTRGVILTGPNDDIHVTNSNTDNGEPPSMDGNTLVTNVANGDNNEPPSMDNDGVTQTQHHTTPQHSDTILPNQVGPLVPQPSLPTLHASTLPLAPPLPTPPANRTTNNVHNSIRRDHTTMDMEPYDDISTFLSHIRHAADDAASSPSRPVRTESTHPPPATVYGPMVDSDETIGSANTGTSVAAHSTAEPTNNASPKKRRRRSRGPGCEARHDLYHTSKRRETTGGPENQGGADMRDADRGGAWP